MCIRFRPLRLAEVMWRIGLPRSSLYSLMGRGLFPSHVSIGPRAVAWREEEVAEWIEYRPRASETGRRA
jgi:prophage regulatory protein